MCGRGGPRRKDCEIEFVASATGELGVLSSAPVMLEENAHGTTIPSLCSGCKLVNTHRRTGDACAEAVLDGALLPARASRKPGGASLMAPHPLPSSGDKHGGDGNCDGGKRACCAGAGFGLFLHCRFAATSKVTPSSLGQLDCPSAPPSRNMPVGARLALRLEATGFVGRLIVRGERALVPGDRSSPPISESPMSSSSSGWVMNAE